MSSTGRRPRRVVALTPDQLTELSTVGRRLEDGRGSPQDIEWAIDQDGQLWLLQARPITTLFPLPPESDRPLPRVYVEFGHVQGMLQPVTPMGMSTLKSVLANMFRSFGITVEIVDIGGRLYGDLSDLARGKSTRKRLVKLMAVDFGPRAQAVIEHVLTDPRFAPQPVAPARDSAALRGTSCVRRPGPWPVSSVRWPGRRRPATDCCVDIAQIKKDVTRPRPTYAPPPERLDFVDTHDSSSGHERIIWPIVTGIMVAAAPAPLLKGIATESEVNIVLGGMPHNVTIDMDLALWRLAEQAAGHRDLLSDTPPAELAARYLDGRCPTSDWRRSWTPTATGPWPRSTSVFPGGTRTRRRSSP